MQVSLYASSRPVQPIPHSIGTPLPSCPYRRLLQQVVVNSAGAYIRPLAGVCLDVMQAWDIPVCVNMYITAAGQKTSAPPHTDKQDVFVMQTQVNGGVLRALGGCRTGGGGGWGVGGGIDVVRVITVGGLSW